MAYRLGSGRLQSVGLLAGYEKNEKWICQKTEE